MGIIARDKNQLTFIYSSNTRVGTHALSYLQGSSDKILAIDISKTKVSDTQWVEIAELLSKKVADLVDIREIDVSDTSSFGTNDWIKILQKNDRALSKPIVINGDKTRQIDNPTEVLEFFQVESAGLKKTMHTDTPTIESTTQDEKFIE
ncbi:arsenate reductase family protein [Ulvibacter sp. MAR_2010_11]|uniref:arsenate reductase family protein n=1 Tax=Ulvibacter sp. MAR_2010_11 TaxID=1250229 RepID=UPI0012FDB806|nr:hypothetical protein [Ulvibacter sp. MAR_2010_11]